MHPSLIAACVLAVILLAVTAAMWVLSLTGLLASRDVPHHRTCGHESWLAGVESPECWHCHWVRAKHAVSLAAHLVVPHH